MRAPGPATSLYGYCTYNQTRSQDRWAAPSQTMWKGISTFTSKQPAHVQSHDPQMQSPGRVNHLGPWQCASNVNFCSGLIHHVWVYLFVCVCVTVWVYGMFLCVHTCMTMCTCLCLCIHVWLCVNVCVYVWFCMCMHAYVTVCECACVMCMIVCECMCLCLCMQKLTKPRISPHNNGNKSLLKEKYKNVLFFHYKVCFWLCSQQLYMI